MHNRQSHSRAGRASWRAPVGRNPHPHRAFGRLQAGRARRLRAGQPPEGRRARAAQAPGHRAAQAGWRGRHGPSRAWIAEAERGEEPGRGRRGVGVGGGVPAGGAVTGRAPWGHVPRFSAGQPPPPPPPAQAETSLHPFGKYHCFLDLVFFHVSVDSCVDAYCFILWDLPGCT